MAHASRRRGFGLVETVVGIGVFLIIFMALLGFLRISIILSAVGKASATATALAQSQMEYVRGFAYDGIGTVGGIPSGTIPQTATTTISSVIFVTHTLVEYIDDPADGFAGADSNGITTDYKVAKVTITYRVGSIAKSLSLLSNFVPPTMESSTGGGTLRVRVVDATGAGLSGATVRIVNALTSPTVDLSTFSNSSGVVYLPGAATSTAYQVYVSRSGYSSAQTYATSVANPNPTPGLLTIAKDQTTTGTFAIDLLSSLTLRTFSPVTTANFSDTFANDSKLAATSSTRVVGGALTLSIAATSGSARSTPFAPQYLSAWGSATASFQAPTDTTAAIQLFDTAGVLIPDSVLPGNASGFTTLPVDLSAISTSTYPALEVGALLTTATTSAPQVLDWSLAASAGPTPLTNVAFTLTGAKTIGTTAGGASIYKTIVTDTTGESALKTLSLEWDSYSLSIGSYDIIDACPFLPYTLAPGGSVSAQLILGAHTNNMLLVEVVDSAGHAVQGATVTLTRSGFSAQQSSSACGDAYFGNVAANTYTVTIAKSGYTTTAIPGIVVGGATYHTAAFP